MELPKNFRVKFMPTDTLPCYHDLNPDDKGVPCDFGNHFDAKGRAVPQAMEKNVDAIFARAVLTQFPDNFTLVKGKMADVIDEAKKFEIMAIDQKSPGAESVLKDAMNQINSLTAVQQDSMKKIDVLTKALEDQTIDHKKEIDALTKQIAELKKGK